MDKENTEKKNSAPVQRISKVKAMSIAMLLLVSTSFGFIGGWIGASSERNSDKLIGNSAEGQQTILNESQLISELAEDVGPSVVSLSVTSQGTAQSFFGFDEPVERESAGTGFVIDADKGIVLTNRHVIPEGATDIIITLDDGTDLEDVELIGRTNEGDPLDVAFLRINDKKGKDLKAVKIGDSSEIEVGHRVVAIGNALGQFQNTVTSGIISGYGRDVRAAAAAGGLDSLQNLFQTDAAINQGNSGGPLVSSSGEVIGINTAVAGGQAQNIGFAIPINDVKGLIKSVLETGELKRPYLGIRYVSLTDDYAYQYNVSVNRGAYIPPGRPGNPSIIPGSPADKAGLKEKDVITHVDGKKLGDKNSLTSLISSKTVGEKVGLKVNRGGQEIEITVKLEDAPKR